MKVYQIVRFKRTFGYITVLQEDHVLIKDLQGKMHSIKLKNIQLIPGLDNPIAPKDLHINDFVIIARVIRKKKHPVRLSMDVHQVTEKISDNVRKIDNIIFDINEVPTIRQTSLDGTQMIIGIFKLDWRY